MKKKKIEEITDRINSLLDENPKLICLRPYEARLIVNKIENLKSEIKAVEKFLDNFKGVL